MRPRWAAAALLGLGLSAVAGDGGLAVVAAQAPRPGSPAPAPAAPGVAPSVPGPSPAAAGQARDPFEPLVRPVAPVPPGEARRREEIAGLKLVGIVWDAKSPELIRALVETPDGLGYYLRVNEEKFGGTVVAIQRDGIRFSVKEVVPGGPTQTRTVELKLPKPEAQP